MISDLGLQLAVALGSVMLLLGLMVLIRMQASVQDWSPEMQRKLVHVATGLYALGLPWIFADRWPVFMLLILALGVMLALRLPALARVGAGATLHDVERRSYGDILLVLGIGTVFIHAGLHRGGSAILYVLPLAILTLSDAAAALTGVTYGKRFFTVEDDMKSVEGSVVFFFVSFLLSMICLLALSETPRMNVIYLAAMTAAFATSVEADSWQGFDNFFLPAGLIVFLEAYLEAPPSRLLLILLGFSALVAFALWLAPRVGLSRHAARAYVTASAIILSVIGLAYAILPILVFLAYSLAHRLTPGSTRQPELDILATVALMSFLWLLIGQESGTFNIELYGLTSLIMVVILSGLAGWAWGWMQAMAFGLAAAILCLVIFTNIYGRVEHANNMDVTHGTLALASITGLLLGLFGKRFFHHARAAKLTLVALVLLLSSFALQYFTAMLGDL